MRYEYDAVLHEEEDGGAWVAFPQDLRKEYGVGRMKVHAEFDGVPYDGSVVNMGVKDADGNTCYIIGITKAIRKRIGKSFDDTVTVALRAVPTGK